MSNIPFFLCREILLRLPAVSLLRFRAVCKQWRTAIDDPSFVKTHTNNQLSSNITTIILRNSTGPPFHPLYYFDLEALSFSSNGPQTIHVTPLRFTRSGMSRLLSLPVAACNGLMLIAPTETKWDPQGTTEIWNLLTHERLKLPSLNISTRVLGIGLGFDCAADDYKVVVIDYDNHKSLRQTHVYSLKLDSWRMIGNCPFIFCSQSIQHGVFVNGVLHWLTDDRIIALDVGTEKYSNLALPLFPRIRKPISTSLNALGGCLFLSCYKDDGMDVWVMNDYGRRYLWMKLFSLNHRQRLRPVAYMKDKNRVVLLQGLYGFVWYDIDSGSVKTVQIHGSYSGVSAQVSIGSLVRLRDSCGCVAPKMKMADTKLTFCVRDGKDGKDDRSSHDDCYRLDSNSYSSSCEGNKVHATLFNPGSATLPVPVDICREIFLLLPAISLIRIRAVCKAFRSVIDEPGFVKSHTNNQLSSNSTNVIIRNSAGPPFDPLYSFNLDDLNFTDGLQKITATPLNFTHSGLSRLRYFHVAECNGLILVAGKKFEIWNPLTHERLKLPSGKFNTNSERMGLGLGYDESTDDYKVVVIHCRRYRRRCGRSVYQTFVYSLRSDSWSMIGNCPCDDDWWCPVGPGVFLCGALNWLSSPRVSNSKILALDLGTGKYRQLQLPPLRKRFARFGIFGFVERKWYLNVLGGCLILSDFCSANDDESDHFDVWVMRDYGDDDSWIKLFSIAKEQIWPTFNLRPVAYMKDKMQVLMEDGHFRFILFDVGSNSLKAIHIHGLSSKLSAQIIPESIFRLHDNCGVSGRRKRIMKRKSRMEMCDTMLYFCARDPTSRHHYGNSHDSWCKLDSYCYISSSEDEDEDRSSDAFDLN